MGKEPEINIREHLVFLYGDEKANALHDRILKRIRKFQETYPNLTTGIPTDRVSENDVILITYGDMVQRKGEVPLQTLAKFLEDYLVETVSTVHILPFYPYSSDDGFAVIDYKQVNSNLGKWKDIEQFRRNFRLMFDAVINHVSSQSVWFQGFLRGDTAYDDFFTVIEDGKDLSQVFRPRATPVLTSFTTSVGEKLVWTTFSADQVDLNFANPEVLIEVIDILLFYVSHGAEFIRLDAVTFVWKELGTNCINLPQTHRIVQFIRTIFDMVAPGVSVITETNVPHEDNIAYFGDGTNEAQMVYNFALPILTLHTFHSKDSRILLRWASTLDLPSSEATFFNFLACHDGVGLMPVNNILSKEDIKIWIDHTQELGGFVSYKTNEDGSQSPYELNINYLDALNDANDPIGDVEFISKRFLASQSVMLALRGVPGIYFHSLIGSRNWTDGVKESGRYRTINREKMNVEELTRELTNPASLRYHVFQGYHKMLRIRKTNRAFHPMGGQKILLLDKGVFSLIRTSKDRNSSTLCLTNVTDKFILVSLKLKDLSFIEGDFLIDLLTGEEIKLGKEKKDLTLAPYQVLWLQQT